MSATPPCPYCLWPMKAGEDLTACTECESRYHAECWVDNGGCATFGCHVWMQAQQAAAAARPQAPDLAPVATTAAAAPAPASPAAGATPNAPVFNFCDQCGARAEGPVAFCISCGSAFEP